MRTLALAVAPDPWLSPFDKMKAHSTANAVIPGMKDCSFFMLFGYASSA